VDWEPLHKWMLNRAAKVDDMERPPDEVFDQYDREHRQGGKHGEGHAEVGEHHDGQTLGGPKGVY